MDRSIGVLYVIDELLQLGGAEQNLIRILNHLPRDRFRPHLLTFRFNPEAFRALPCPVEVYPVHNVYGWNALRHAPRLLRWIRRERIRIVHTFFETSDIWAGTVVRAATQAALISGRRDLGIQRNARLNLLYRLLGRHLFHQVQAVSDQVRDYVIASDRMDPSLVVTVPNGIDLASMPHPDAGPAARARWGLPEGRPLIVTVANVRPVKGIDMLVRAAEVVSRERPETLFVVAGRILEPDYYSEIETRVKRLGLEGHVRFLGQVDSPLALLRAADIFFLPSRSEGMSNALLEAMASSLPAVATAVGGNCQLVAEGETGFLVPAGDPDTAAARLLQLLQDPCLARRMGDVARRLVEQRYSLEAMIHLMVGHYEALLEG